MYIYIYIYIHIHTRAYIYIYICIYIYIYVDLYTYIHMHTHIRIHMCVRIWRSEHRIGVGRAAPADGFAGERLLVVAIFYPFGQFCEIDISLLSLQTQD